MHCCVLEVILWCSAFSFPQACMRDIPSCKWLDQWTELAQKYCPPSTPVQWRAVASHCMAWLWMPICLDFRFAFQYNPSLQPRALVVFGCISKRVSHGQIKQIIRILSKASPLLSIDRVRPSRLTCCSPSPAAPSSSKLIKSPFMAHYPLFCGESHNDPELICKNRWFPWFV